MFVILLLCLIVPIFLWFYLQNDFIDWICWLIVGRAKSYRFRHFPKRIVLIRHGESQGNQDSNLYSTTPDHAIGLTKHGEEQSRQCGEKLRRIFGENELVMFYVSPFHRSRETCRLIREAFPKKQIYKVREDPRIREQEW